MKRNPSAPSHLPAAAVRRVFKAEGIFIPWGTMHNLMMKGRELEAELHHGSRLIPMHRVMAYLEARRASEKPQDQTPGPQA